MININEEELQCKICYEFLYETVLCDKCSNAFCQECAINYKNKAKKYGRVDKCPICGSKNFTFQRCEEIDKLIKKRKQKPLQCQHCKRIIFDKEKYEQHIQQCKYQCKFCLMVFDKEDNLLRHIKKNTTELFKALDLMNASRNKVIYNKDKPRKKKLIKKRTKELFNNNEEKEEKNEEKEDAEINSELSKKVVKKKVIKKKKKIVKKKERGNSNTINYVDNNINEEELLKSKMNKTTTEDKLINEIKKLNISAEIKFDDKNTKKVYIKNRPLRISGNSKDNIHNNISSNHSRNKDEEIIRKSIHNNIIINNKNIINNNKNIINNIYNNKNNFNNDINTNIDNSKDESKKESDKFEKTTDKDEEKKEEKVNNRKEQEIIFSTSGKKNFNFNNQIIEEEEKISRYVDYLNNPRPESVRPSTIPGEAKLNIEYDLFFCGKPNHIDCICCTEHKCRPGACMCISCMKLNKKYHKLKSHYLINKSGRACKYSHGFFHCYCNYTHIVHDVGNNIFKPVYRCQGENICKPCEEITLLMETYLPSTICQKLRDREARQAQF